MQKLLQSEPATIAARRAPPDVQKPGPSHDIQNCPSRDMYARGKHRATKNGREIQGSNLATPCRDGTRFWASGCGDRHYQTLTHTQRVFSLAICMENGTETERTTGHYVGLRGRRHPGDHDESKGFTRPTSPPTSESYTDDHTPRTPNPRRATQVCRSPEEQVMVRKIQLVGSNVELCPVEDIPLEPARRNTRWPRSLRNGARSLPLPVRQNHTPAQQLATYQCHTTATFCRELKVMCSTSLGATRTRQT
jgi:hypothetical protein